MKYLVTGAGGFIGNHIYKKLCNSTIKIGGGKVVGIDRRANYTYSNHPYCNEGSSFGIRTYCELQNKEWVQRLLGEYKPDVIFHFAGCATVNSPARLIWNSNVDTTFNLIDCLPQGHKVRFIAASSIVTDFVNSPYAASKAAVENLIAAYNRYDNNFIGTAIRFCAVAGANNTHGAVRDIVRKFVQDDKVVLFGNSPGSIKPYLYINNLVDSILNLIGVEDDNLTICPPDNISILSIAEIVKKYVGQDKTIEFNGDVWKGDVGYVTGSDDSYNYSNVKILSSREAIELAVRDILRLEYGVNNNE